MPPGAPTRSTVLSLGEDARPLKQMNDLGMSVTSAIHSCPRPGPFLYIYIYTHSSVTDHGGLSFFWTRGARVLSGGMWLITRAGVPVRIAVSRGVLAKTC